ncbi:30S ribosomal protein S8 [Candidatus Shapirobacteria bacterium CG_4_8_14_3_um_filter_35_11]|uniref:Small ribosomal subunit protein uS8 n=6 Tax=Candidatus Shapironibacteriota TaxID=1752721 RepID=A0A1J5HPA6_9BACT|nr:MAG: 30S ribosomal protein S8 [Candidatus Shapirobacteria bacterium CG2_30_35_20]PIV07754.1 MAG: 30S ribosomal protein S8 [Candidatus Shapirobacteria bacterium CG03_land_8_20_14_0_80_35_14]PIX68358.1 MAG: 30S ribosomal protein S8 [Candidatus Shapirobacteria bacterium CG_4_10_14_3_um_filter_35_13]PJA51312.1 MAG: 30S ribosomal protein S8 [Candidatus Shapirobacteria bacterium CG_4_9_14_3_um_filter_36_12]PJC80339.1 MAG: 30S ribosomal protein S8 [Candidatus Shapirobacteria bacterium CG_4_8_14_3_u
MMNSLYCDLLIRVKNASRSSRKSFTAINSSFSRNICEKLKKHHFITDFTVDDETHLLTIISPVVSDIEILSKPGRHLYVNSHNIPWGKSPKSLIIISTSLGLLSQREAVAKKVGGELIAQIW